MTIPIWELQIESFFWVLGAVISFKEISFGALKELTPSKEMDQLHVGDLVLAMYVGLLGWPAKV